MDPGGVDRVDGVHAGDHGRDDRPGQLVDQLAERRVFLRRPAHRGERPDGALAVIHPLDSQHREVVGQAVVAEVVAERPLGLPHVRVDRAGDHEVGLGRHGQASVGRDHGDPPPAQGPGEGELGQPFGQRHHGGDGQGRGAADEDVDPERLAPPDRRGMMHADPAVDLVVQADLPVRLVSVARELDAVHPEVRPAPGRAGRDPRCRPGAA